VGSFVVGMCAYRSASVSSCICNRMEVHQHRSNSRHSGGSMTTFLGPICDCGELTISITATAVKNGGRQFWGGPKYKVRCIELWFIKKNIGIDCFGYRFV